MDIPTMIEAVQRELGLIVDGKAGPVTWSAIYRYVLDRPEQETDRGTLVDDRSEKEIAKLQEKVQPYARNLVRMAADQGIRIIVTSGLRTYEEQQQKYAQGRTTPGKIVTNAKAGYSMHNFGLAFDVTIFSGSTPVWESPNYKAIGAIGRSLGLEWGGDWKTIMDEPHFQLRPNWAHGLSESAMLWQLRSRKATGTDFLA
jgi:peptidoglycan L-alanyl-D-glutamate endopeptidase CwlK